MYNKSSFKIVVVALSALLCLLAPHDLALTRLSVKEPDSWNGFTSESSYAPNFNPFWPISAAKFAKCAGKEHILAIGNGCGQIALLDTNLQNNNQGGEQTLLLGKQCHGDGVFDVDWMPGHMKLVSASADRTARLFTVTESSLELERTYNDHSQAVKTVAFRRTDPAVFASGGRDGVIALWDSRASCGSNKAPKADNFIYGGHTGGPGTPSEFGKRQLPLDMYNRSASCSITGLAFQDDNTLISCGAGDGIVKVWDVRRHYSSHKRDPLPKHSLPYAGTSFKGFTNLLIDHGRSRLYVNCMDNHIYCYDISGYPAEPIQRYGGFENNTYFIKSCLSPDGQYLLSSSGDSNSYIWNVDNPNPLVRFEGHKVSSVAWMPSRNDIRIVTCNGVPCRCIAMIKIWRVGPEEIDEDMHVLYKGHAKFCDGYWQKSGKIRFKSWESAPRFIPNIIDRKPPLKRTFLELALPSSSRSLQILEESTKPSVQSSSPTANLPNFVLDGEAPHLVNVTNNPNKRKLKENASDWLTKIRQQKLLKLQAAKPVSIETKSTNGTKSPRQRSSRSGPTGGQSRTPTSSRTSRQLSTPETTKLRRSPALKSPTLAPTGSGTNV